MEQDIIYFELNNWFSGDHYPAEEPFYTWCGDDLKLYFSDDDWVKENKLVVVETIIDMSFNWTITAPKSWIEANCPRLLTEPEFSKFVKHPNEYGEVKGRFATPFLPYEEENIGVTAYDWDRTNLQWVPSLNDENAET